MKKEADKLHTRAVAGESCQASRMKAAFTCGIRTKAPSTKMGKQRRNNLPPTQAAVMDLKTGEICLLCSPTKADILFTRSAASSSATTP